MKKEVILEKVEMLMNMYQEGLLGGEVMPENQNPHLPKDSLENYLYFTLPMALNYQRNSYTLWECAYKTYQDEKTNFVFHPKICLKKSFEEVQSALTKYRLALQKQKQTEIWIILCQTLVNLFDGDIRKLFAKMNHDVDCIRNFIQVEHKKEFPYLSGIKICNYWLYVIQQYTDEEYCNQNHLTVAPDTHVCKATRKLGLITEEEFQSSHVQETVINAWKQLLEGTKYHPIDIHTPLWLWSRNGFTDLTKYPMLDKIVHSSYEVMKRAKSISISKEAIQSLIRHKIPKGKHWGEANAFGFMNYDIETIVSFLLVFQSVDFSFWGKEKWTIDTADYGVLDGSQALMYVFVKNMNLITDFKKLEQMTFPEFQNLLKGNHELPLLRERYHIIQEIAHIVNNQMNGNFYEYIKGITDDRELFQIIIDYFPTFKDERTYDGKPVYFYKLASLLVSDIMHIRNKKEKNIYDYSHIVGCADYKIPQIMRNLGILEYEDTLSRAIDKREEIPENSAWEVEIRAATIVVLDILRKKTGLCGMEVNDFLWLSSQSVKSSKPYHLTRNTNY